jgi:hypothetical protein
VTAAFAFNRTLNVPADGKLAVAPHVVPSFETSNPAGAVATIGAVKSVPETENVCTPEATPYVVVNTAVVPATGPVITGVAFGAELTTMSSTRMRSLEPDPETKAYNQRSCTTGWLFAAAGTAKLLKVSAAPAPAPFDV